eukprot:3934127-Prorocentrum_lima.AAC.1
MGSVGKRPLGSGPRKGGKPPKMGILGKRPLGSGPREGGKPPKNGDSREEALGFRPQRSCLLYTSPSPRDSTSS